MKTKIRFTLILLVGLIATAFSQKLDDKVLMTIDGKPIYVKEFKKVYLKNLDLVEETDQKNIDSYLELYKNFKLKLAQAYDLGLDKREDLKKELQGYKRQLANNYMTVAPLKESLVKEAYDHMTEEVRASHLMISLQNAKTPADTLLAYQKIDSIRQVILAGADFETIAKQVSEDPSVKNNGGDLGWFDAFKMVYPFEKAAYDTPVGEISPIIKTRYGYHLLKTTGKRASRGEIEAAHIYIASSQKDTAINPEKRIREIYAKLKQGETFEELARKYSEDQRSGKDGGKIRRFKSGELNSPIFEENVFALEEGQVSEPFQSELGWHIAKAIKKYPIGSFEELRESLEKKVKGDSRSKLVEEALIEKLNNLYTTTVNLQAITDFSNSLNEAFLKGKWNGDLGDLNSEETAITIQDSSFNYKDFGYYLKQNQLDNISYITVSEKVKDLYETYKINCLKDYHREHLGEINPDYAAIVNEYEEGVLLFALMEEKIWEKAKNDSLGLKKYYQDHIANYNWPKRYDVEIASATTLESANKARAMYVEGVSTSEIREKLNTDNRVEVFFTNKLVAVDDDLLPTGFEPKLGVSKIYEDKDFVFINLKEIVPAMPKELDEARGLVMGDFQEEVEAQWLDSLNGGHTVSIDKKILKKLKKELSR